MWMYFIPTGAAIGLATNLIIQAISGKHDHFSTIVAIVYVLFVSMLMRYGYNQFIKEKSKVTPRVVPTTRKNTRKYKEA